MQVWNFGDQCALGCEVLRSLSEFYQLNTHLIDVYRGIYLYFSMVVCIFVRTEILVDYPGNQTPRIKGPSWLEQNQRRS